MTNAQTIWIIDDDRSIRWVFEKALARENLDFKSFGSAKEALTELEHTTPQVVVSDIRMPGGSGLDLLKTVKQRHPAIPVIIMTAYSDLDSAVAAFQGGAFEYLAKPFDVDHAVELIRRALDESRRGQDAAETFEAAQEILGQAPSMQEVFRAIGRLAQSHATVLITGESGTGKELVARAIHNNSQRRVRPLVKVNCATLPAHLIESELFGHERGAFTGAQTRQLGRFEVADGTSIFLDEIGELPPELQIKLLRVLQDGEFERLGSSRTIKVDVRVIAATNRDLEEEVRQGRFREDLFYRLNVFPITVPPLRQRAEDIFLLARFFVEKASKRLGKSIEQIPESVMQKLQDYSWPGNVRELENVIERAVLNSSGPRLRLADDLTGPTHNPMHPPLKSLQETEKDHILQVLQVTNWRIDGAKGAALILDMNPSTLRSRMRKLGIQKT